MEKTIQTRQARPTYAGAEVQPTHQPRHCAWTWQPTPHRAWMQQTNKQPKRDDRRGKKELRLLSKHQSVYQVTEKARQKCKEKATGQQASNQSMHRATRKKRTFNQTPLALTINQEDTTWVQRTDRSPSEPPINLSRNYSINTPIKKTQ